MGDFSFIEEYTVELPPGGRPHFGSDYEPLKTLYVESTRFLERQRREEIQLKRHG
jgi:hypothetical protein